MERRVAETADDLHTVFRHIEPESGRPVTQDKLSIITKHEIGGVVLDVLSRASEARSVKATGSAASSVSVASPLEPRVKPSHASCHGPVPICCFLAQNSEDQSHAVAIPLAHSGWMRSMHILKWYEPSFLSSRKSPGVKVFTCRNLLRRIWL